MCYSSFSELDAGPTVLGDDVASNIRLTVHSHTKNAVVATLTDVITPDQGSRIGRFIITNDFDSVFKGLLDCVVDNARFIIVNLNTVLVKNHFITVDLIKR